MPELDPNPILLLSREGQVVRLNREACRMLSMVTDAVVGKPILAHVVPEDRERAREIFLRVPSGQEREWIGRFKRGEGATRAQWVRAVPIVTEGTVAPSSCSPGT